MLHTAYRRCTANLNKTLLPTSPALVRSSPIAVVSGKTDYTLSFDIVPNGTITDGYASILHFTTGTDCCDFGSRSPAIWFRPGSTELHVRIGDSTDSNWGFDAQMHYLLISVPKLHLNAMKIM